jgi:hypothetical protein
VQPSDELPREETHFVAGLQSHQLLPAWWGKRRFNALTGHRIGTFRDRRLGRLFEPLAAPATCECECYYVAGVVFSTSQSWAKPLSARYD